MKKLMIIILLASLAGCYYDSAEELYPNPLDGCDTSNVTYSGTVFPIIDNECSQCHTGTAPEANIMLADYESISFQALIEAGNPGSLYGAISHHPHNIAMPKNGTQLSECKIAQIRTWIREGALDN